MRTLGIHGCKYFRACRHMEFPPLISKFQRKEHFFVHCAIDNFASIRILVCTCMCWAAVESGCCQLCVRCSNASTASKCSSIPSAFPASTPCVHVASPCATHAAPNAQSASLATHSPTRPISRPCSRVGKRRNKWNPRRVALELALALALAVTWLQRTRPKKVHLSALWYFNVYLRDEGNAPYFFSLCIHPSNAFLSGGELPTPSLPSGVARIFFGGGRPGHLKAITRQQQGSGERRPPGG